jgi:hypothetical protein
VVGRVAAPVPTATSCRRGVGVFPTWDFGPWTAPRPVRVSRTSSNQLRGFKGEIIAAKERKGKTGDFHPRITLTTRMGNGKRRPERSPGKNAGFFSFSAFAQNWVPFGGQAEPVRPSQTSWGKAISWRRGSDPPAGFRALWRRVRPGRTQSNQFRVKNPARSAQVPFRARLAGKHAPTLEVWFLELLWCLVLPPERRPVRLGRTWSNRFEAGGAAPASCRLRVFSHLRPSE